MLPRSPRTRRLLALVLLALAAVGTVALVVSGTPDDRPRFADPREAADGSTVVAVARVSGAQGLAVVDGEVRVTNLQALTRTVVDPDTGEVGEARVIGGLGRLERSVAGEGARWLVGTDGLLRLDPDSGDVLDTVPLDAPGGVVAVGEGAVWITVARLPVPGGGGATSSVIQRVDVATGEVLSLPVEDGVTFRFALGDGAAWATAGRTLFRLDVTSLVPTGEVELPEPTSGLVVADGVVWAVTAPPDDGGPATLVGVDAATLDTVAPIDLGPGAVDDVALRRTDDGHELWIVRPESATVTRVALPADGDGATVVDVAVDRPREVEVDGDRVWVTSGADGGTLWRIDVAPLAPSP
ncbi:MAG TPA: hypothetical protein VK866_11960 [Acidimicrobiales bacterium]|nr:hypothetical protein [Acidimicrobiales bacterium]